MSSRTDDKGGAGHIGAPSPGTVTGGVDPTTLSVLWGALVSLADDMGATLRRTAFSPAVREGDDFSTGLFDARGRLIAQGNFSPGHLGAMPWVVGHVLDHFPPESLRPGDGILLNDSALGSGHYPDCFLTTPLFVDGALAGFAVNCAHHSDMGGAVPGSQIVDVREAWQEGLRILPVRLFREGEPDPDLLRLITGNVRLPEVVRGDLLAQRNTNAFAARALPRLIERFGRAAFEEGIEAILERSERRMRSLISELPDGTWSWEDCLDDRGNADEPVRVAVDVTIAGDRLTLDWSRSSDQVPAGINAYLNYTRAYSVFAVKVFTDPHLPHNEGANRPIEVTAREGSFFNPVFPAPSSGRAAVQIRLFEVVCAALAQVVPERALAAFSHWGNPVLGGSDDGEGRAFVFYDLLYGGYGGSAARDGEEALCPVFNASNIPVEVHEAQAPVRIRRLELIAESAGRGRHRGGHGLRKDIELLAPRATASLSGDRHRFPPPGLAGGEAGRPGESLLIRNGRSTRLRSKAVCELERGDVLSIRLAGAGGYGPPEERAPEAIEADLRDGYLSPEGAAAWRALLRGGNTSESEGD